MRDIMETIALSASLKEYLGPEQAIKILSIAIQEEVDKGNLPAQECLSCGKPVFRLPMQIWAVMAKEMGKMLHCTSCDQQLQVDREHVWEDPAEE